MSKSIYYLFALFLMLVLFWQLVSGQALGTRWRSNITREYDPKAYWFVLAAQGAILILFLATGMKWHLR